MSIHRKRYKSLGLPELVAIALGGMVGGGIFTILGISVSMIGNLTPFAIIVGGIIAGAAAYSYIKLGIYYQDEGATYAFYKRTYPGSPFSSALIGWFVVFGYISTLALYAYTFASYAISNLDFSNVVLMRKIFAIGIIGVFTAVNVWSVNGMGKIEDLMVYTKLVILAIISFVLIQHGSMGFETYIRSIPNEIQHSGYLNILIVASITFVAYEGFQLVINAVKEMETPEKTIPKAIYTALALAVLIYVVISIGALFSIPKSEIIRNKEFALAAGAGGALGTPGVVLVITGAVLATCSAISGTLFGSSRQLAAIADDNYFPKVFSVRKNKIPVNAIFCMSGVASVLILIGGLELILEFGSITFILVSLLMSIANNKIRDKTRSVSLLTLGSIVTLTFGGAMILYYKFNHAPIQLLFIISIYLILGLGAFAYSRFYRK